MDDTKTKLEADSLEKVFLQPLDSLKTDRLTVDDTKAFIGLSFMKEEHIDRAWQDLTKQAWAIEAWELRVEIALTIKVDRKTLMFIALRVEGNVGQGIAYIYYLQYWCKMNNVKEVTLDMLFSRIFPMGLFSEEVIHEHWLLQKVRGYNGLDNMIDYSEASKSIMF
mgnify:CR=1 FL=1|tara:strand:- start:56022 stop:56519 length:498 start_codon:yes stop_codon:yes gene_type:complete